MRDLYLEEQIGKSKKPLVLPSLEDPMGEHEGLDKFIPDQHNEELGRTWHRNSECSVERTIVG